jgi:hypothetical protein
MANNAASSGFLFSELKPILESLGRGKILAIVTDSAKNCKSLRDKCEQFSPNILNLSCFVHSLNLICGKFLKIEKIDSVVSDCMRIISVFNYSNKLTAELKITNEMISSRGSRLAKVGNTRFSTHYDCISSLLSNEEGIKVLAENMRIGVEIKNIIRDEIWWINLKNVADLMKPIYQLIKFSESSTFRLSDSYVGILRMVYNIMNISEASHFGRAISKDIHNILSIRLDLMLKDDIFMVATFLDHRYNLINWSQSARARILKRLLEYLKGYNASEEELHQTRLQFEKFIPRKYLDKFIDSTSYLVF